MENGASTPRGRKFTHVEYPEPHRDRARQILEKHPDVRKLFGRQPLSALITIAVVGLQVGLAIALRNQPWWAVLAVAWLVGAWATHCLWVLIHEATHNLINKEKIANRAFGILANLPMLVPSAESFRIYHLKHHKFQGDYLLDADLPSHWEAKLIGSTIFGKLLWQLLFPIFQSLRVVRFSRAGNISFVTPGVITNIVMSFAFDGAMFYFFGPMAMLYLGASLVFSIGPHPAGARWIQEHYLTWEHNQETGSYYGAANILALNVGYHNEHHDFPFIPWHRLPDLKKLAPEMYDTLESYDSYTKLWLRFLFQPQITLFSRVTRDGEVNLKRVEMRERVREAQAAVIANGAEATAPAALGTAEPA